MKKKYTAKEIQDLRMACDYLWLWGTLAQIEGTPRSFYEPEKTQAVEAMVQTYMEAGITADDLYREHGEKKKTA